LNALRSLGGEEFEGESWLPRPFSLSEHIFDMHADRFKIAGEMQKGTFNLLKRDVSME
jgi:hypothetical protein